MRVTAPSPHTRVVAGGCRVQVREPRVPGLPISPAPRRRFPVGWSLRARAPEVASRCHPRPRGIDTNQSSLHPDPNSFENAGSTLDNLRLAHGHRPRRIRRRDRRQHHPRLAPDEPMPNSPGGDVDIRTTVALSPLPGRFHRWHPSPAIRIELVNGSPSSTNT